jgi:hypothetical protein
MAFITEQKLTEIKDQYDRASKAVQRMKAKAEEQAGKAKTAAAIVGGGMLGGYLDGRIGALPGTKNKAGKPIREGHYEVFGFQVQPSVGLGAAAVLASFFDLFGKNTDDVAALGAGMLAGAAYSYGNATGSAGQKAGTLIGGAAPGAAPEIIGHSAAVGADAAIGAAVPWAMPR